TFNVPSKAALFQAVVGVTDNRRTCLKTSFRLNVLDPKGNPVWSSKTFVPEGIAPADLGPGPFGTDPEAISVPVAGLSQITMQVDGLDDGSDCDYGNWADARFTPR